MRTSEARVTELKVQRDAVLALSAEQGVRVECREGSVWITIDHDLRDIVLGPGESFEHAGTRRLLVLSLEASSVRISSCARAATKRADAAAFRWRRHAQPPRIALV